MTPRLLIVTLMGVLALVLATATLADVSASLRWVSPGVQLYIEQANYPWGNEWWGRPGPYGYYDHRYYPYTYPYRYYYDPYPYRYHYYYNPPYHRQYPYHPRGWDRPRWDGDDHRWRGRGWRGDDDGRGRHRGGRDD